jgi:hypothetical protein
LDNGDGHDVDAAAFPVLLLEGDIEIVSLPPVLPISGENPKLRFRRRRCSGVVPSLEETF